MIAHEVAPSHLEQCVPNAAIVLGLEELDLSALEFAIAQVPGGLGIFPP
jgi:hypothetical protein